MAGYALTDLIQWARASLRPWQQEALHELLLHGELPAETIDALAAQALEEVGNDPTEHTQPLSDDYEAVPLPDVETRVTKISDIRHVNGLGGGPIELSAEGLHVVFGENASGKSGIARILHRACRTRAASGAILPNVYLEPPAEPASATIEYLCGKEVGEYRWVDGASDITPIQAVHVFDSATATQHVGGQTLVTYTPEILQLFRLLAHAVQSVKASLERMQTQLGAGSDALDAIALTLGQESAAAEYLLRLSADSTVGQLDALCDISPNELDRRAELALALADSPLERAEVRQKQARMLRAIVGQARGASEVLTAEAMSELGELARERDEAREAAAAATQVFGAEQHLNGVGGPTWRRLWDAARRYSEATAFPGEAFPVVREGALCLLCQQELPPSVGTRLIGFQQYVTDTAQREAEEAEASLQHAVGVIAAAVPQWPTRRLVVEAGVANTPIGHALRRSMVSAMLRRRHAFQMARGAASSTSEELPELTTPPATEALVASMEAEVARLREAANADSRAQMVKEHQDLEDRVTLAPHRDLIFAEVDRLRRLAQLHAASASCSTHSITLKGGQVAEQVITEPLRREFAANLDELGLVDAPVHVQRGRGAYGEHPLQIRIAAPLDVNPALVLSEGERTCVGLAGILAELRVTGNRSTLVLDDPVSSLDHQNRVRVAQRLVKEARSRQVIILTHDLFFLYQLKRAATALGIPIDYTTLRRGVQGNHGRATPGLPDAAVRLKDRISRLRSRAAEARRVLTDGDRDSYEQLARGIYVALRAAWERAVEEVLLAGVVTRFDVAVHTMKLGDIVISQDDVDKVALAMTRCSEFAHDAAAEAHSGIPEPATLEAEISELSAWISELNGRRKR